MHATMHSSTNCLFIHSVIIIFSNHPVFTYSLFIFFRFFFHSFIRPSVRSFVYLCMHSSTNCLIIPSSFPNHPLIYSLVSFRFFFHSFICPFISFNQFCKTYYHHLTGFFTCFYRPFITISYIFTGLSKMYANEELSNFKEKRPTLVYQHRENI